MSKKLIFGLGTGRCGSMTLANLLSLQDDCLVSHEVGGLPHLSWDCNEREFSSYLNKINNRPGKYSGDVSFYTLPYANILIEMSPEVKFVILKRDKKQTISSYKKKTDGRNHWIRHNGTKWKKDIWDKCYPKFETENKDEALEMYYDLYYSECLKIDQERCYWISTEQLNDENKCLEMLKWCGFEKPRFMIMKKNKGKK